jgi:hypothetical protein
LIAPVTGAGIEKDFLPRLRVQFRKTIPGLAFNSTGANRACRTRDIRHQQGQQA